MSLLKNQADISGVNPMPVDRVDDTSVTNTSSAETVVWYYLSSSAWAAASAQGAGTICMAKLTYTGVLNSIGSAVGTFADTSLTWGAATRVSTLVTCPEEVLSRMQFMSETDQVATITPFLATNGDYIIDHRRGQVWMKAKATAANDAATYLYATPLTGGGTGDKVDVIKVGGVAAPVEDAAVTSTGIHPLWESADFDGSALPNQTNEGDATRPKTTLAGVPYGFLTNEAGTKTPVVVDDTGQVATPEMINVGGEYRASPTTYTDGDATILQTDVNGQLKVALSSDIEIGAVEIKDGTTDARQAVKVDNATASATPTVALTGGIYKATPDTYDDNDATPFHFDVNGKLLTTTAIDEFPAAAAITDNFANPTTTNVMAMGMAWDGSTWDRILGNSTDGLTVNLGANNDVTATCTATDLDIRDLANATDSVSIYGSDDGGTTKRIIKTDSGGAIQVDLEVANVALTASTLASTTALATNLVAKASAGALAGVSGVNTSASAQYIQVHNTASLPADTAIPVICFKVDAGENFSYTPIAPVTFSTGITVCNSSTVPTKTIGSADTWFQVEYT